MALKFFGARDRNRTGMPKARDFLTTTSFDATFAIISSLLGTSYSMFVVWTVSLPLLITYNCYYCFRYFPYSLYTFLIVCRSIAALSFDWQFSRYRSHRLGSALAYFLCDKFTALIYPILMKRSPTLRRFTQRSPALEAVEDYYLTNHFWKSTCTTYSYFVVLPSFDCTVTPSDIYLTPLLGL